MHEVSFMGLRIVAQQYNGLFDNSDTMGFRVPAAFAVIDDFDEPALPLVQQWHWSPWDARNAIWFCAWYKEHIIPGRRWKDSQSWKFCDLLEYRRKPHLPFAAVQDIKKIIAESADFDENPAKLITLRIEQLERELRAWPAEKSEPI